MNKENKISELLKRVDDITKLQNQLNNDIFFLKNQIVELSNNNETETTTNESNSFESNNDTNISDTIKNSEQNVKEIYFNTKFKYQDKFESNYTKNEEDYFKKNNKSKTSVDFEKFIGENLVNKIGILITLIGIAIGTKYAIDNNLISPSLRIILAYIFGIGLTFTALKLKEKYKDLSSVIASGSAATFYITTYFAKTAYNFFPELVAFALMLLFSIYTVYLALLYDRQVISIIGFVAAFVIPVLVSQNSNNVIGFFSYISFINLAILYLSYKKNWRLLLYSSSIATISVFYMWYNSDYIPELQFKIALIFLMIFLFQTVLSFFIHISYYIYSDKYQIKSDSVLYSEHIYLSFYLLFMFIFSYDLFNYNESIYSLYSLFTLSNSIIFSLFSFWIAFKRNQGDKPIFQIFLALAISLFTVTIPIEFENEWITLFWIIEAFAFFIIGRKNKILLFEISSILLVLISSYNLLDDYSSYSHYLRDTNYYTYKFFGFNFNFLNFSLIILSIYFIQLKSKNQYFNYLKDDYEIYQTSIKNILSIVFIFLISIVGIYEISIFFANWVEITKIISTENIETISYYENENLKLLSNVVCLVYIFIIFLLISRYNLKNNSPKYINRVNIIANHFLFFLFYTFGFYSLDQLTSNYISKLPDDIAFASVWYVISRYFALIALFILRYYNQKLIFAGNRSKSLNFYEIIYYLQHILILSVELVTILDLFQVDNSTKLSLSILWGLCALAIVFIGFKQKKSHLRLTSFTILGFTLIKIFLFDLNHLSTLQKTSIFLILGVLMLFISYVYNKKKILKDIP